MLVFYFYLLFADNTVGGFVNQKIKKWWPYWRHDGNKTSKWRYKMHVISNTKIDFLRFCLSNFFSIEKILDGLLGKNGKLTGHVLMFCTSGSLLFDGIDEKICAEHQESNSRPIPQKHWLNLRRSSDFLFGIFGPSRLSISFLTDPKGENEISPGTRKQISHVTGARLELAAVGQRWDKRYRGGAAKLKNKSIFVIK